MLPTKLSHYRLEEQIGAGGMGVVYRAHDEYLERDVGIKVLPSGSLTDAGARKRFRKEALSLAKLNHPNIATVHEFGTDSNTDFLVTEYIEGITLDSKLASGALPMEIVINLGIQLTDGLSAAHKRGIVHRDLKPANLRLTPDGRLKILDFGLAQLMPHVSDLSITATATGSHEVSGTLPYMAPEQLRGAKADASNDIWSAGAVLYEMATGKKPFPQTNPSLLINAILNEAPEPPSKINPDVTAEMDAVILKALAKDPEARYQSARELAAALGNPGTTQVTVRRVRLSRAARWTLAGACGVLLAATVTGVVLVRRAKRPETVITAAPHRRTVAVLGFKNVSNDSQKAWLSTALSEMLTTELSEGDQLRTIPGESVAQMKISLALPDAESFSQKTLHRIRQNIGSDDVVMGSYVPLSDGQLRLDLRLQDTRAGETLATVTEKGSETQIDDLISKAGAELRVKMGVEPLSEAQTAVVRAALPSNAEAARLYSQGLQDLRISNVLLARDVLEKAIAIQPDFAPAHSALAQAWSAIGYDEKAKQEAKQALDLSAGASREERLQIEARSHEILGEWPKAVESYRALWEFFPDRVDYGLALAQAQSSGGQMKDAEATLAQLRSLTVPEADAARIDLLDANIGSELGDLKRQHALGERATNEAQAIGANLLVAKGLVMDGDAVEKMGDPDKAVQLCTQAKDLNELAGYRRGAASALLLMGDTLFDKGDFKGARKDFDEALAVFREIGAQKSIRNSMERIGNVLYAEGKPLESEKYYNQALAFDRIVNEPSALASDYGNIANDLDDLGDLKGALKMQLDSLSAYNQINGKEGASETLYNLGTLSIEMGDLAGAKKYFDQALALAKEATFRVGEPYPVAGLGDVLYAQGDLVGARKQYEEAGAAAADAKVEGFGIRVELLLALVDLEEGKAEDGERRALEITRKLEKGNATSSTSLAAFAVLSRALLADGKLAEARTAANRAVSLSHKEVGAPAQFESVLPDSLVKAKSGNAAGARQELESSIAVAHKDGYQVYDYDLRLALCKVELWSHDPSARAHLAALESDAMAHGFLLVANDAHALAQSK
jgi:tetratricopeptide (TPR) repeat protein/TolB-like protein